MLLQLCNVQLHPNDEHEKADPNLAEHPQRAERFRRKDQLEEAGPQPPEQGGPEQDAGEHFTDHSRLPRFVHQAAADPGRQNDEDELDEQPGERVLEILAQVGQE